MRLRHSIITALITLCAPLARATKPYICNASMTSTGTTTIQIVWDTATSNSCATPLLASTKIAWGETNDAEGGDFVTTETDTNPGVSHHVVNLTGLVPSAQYIANVYSAPIVSGSPDHTQEGTLAAQPPNSELGPVTTNTDSGAADVYPYISGPTRGIAGTPLQFMPWARVKSGATLPNNVIFSASLSGGNSGSWTTPFTWVDTTNGWGISSGSSALMTNTIANDSIWSNHTPNYERLQINIPSNATAATYTLTITCYSGAQGSASNTWTLTPTASCTTASTTFTVQASATPAISLPCPGNINCGQLPSSQLTAYNTNMNTWIANCANPSDNTLSNCPGNVLTPQVCVGTALSGGAYGNLNDICFSYYDAPQTLQRLYEYDLVYNISGGHASQWLTWALAWVPNAQYRTASQNYRQNQIQGLIWDFSSPLGHGSTASAYLENSKTALDFQAIGGTDAAGNSTVNLLGGNQANAAAYLFYQNDRPAGWSLDSCLAVRRMGFTLFANGCDVPTLTMLIYQDIAHMLEATGWNATWPPSGIVPGASPSKQPFIIGINMAAARRAYCANDTSAPCANNNYNDSAITSTMKGQLLEAIRVTANYLAANYYDATNQCFIYNWSEYNLNGTGMLITTPVSTGFPLNSFDMDTYAFLWALFGDSPTTTFNGSSQNYRQIADTLFQGSHNFDQLLFSGSRSGKGVNETFGAAGGFFDYALFRGLQITPVSNGSTHAGTTYQLGTVIIH